MKKNNMNTEDLDSHSHALCLDEFCETYVDLHQSDFFLNSYIKCYFDRATV